MTQRRLAAILAADMVGYSRLMAAEEAGTLARLKALRREVIDPEIAKGGGEIVKLTGDGMLVLFGSVVAAVEAAAAIQQAVAAAEAASPADRRIAFRIGLHLGDVILDEGDIYGDGVNIAARLEAEAEPGGITLSGDAMRQVRGKTELAFIDLGDLALKNIPEPVRAHKLDVAPAEQPTGPRSADLGLPPRPVIVVLPFTNLSPDPDQEYFVDGLTEDLIARLSYLRGIDVIPRTSAFTYKNKARKLSEIRESLGARYVLQGSVRKAGNRIRISASLVDAETDDHLWREKFDRLTEDIFALQDEITHAIAIALQVALSDGDMALAPGGTEDYAAWELFQKGVLAHLRYTAEDNIRARRFYAEAIAQDPAFTDARIFRAWTFWQHARSGFTKDRDGAMAECRRTIDALRAEDISTANVKHLEAATLLLERRHDEALGVAAEAVSLGPSKLFGYTPAALVNVYAGELQAAADILRESIRAIPSAPNDSIYYLAVVLTLMGDHARAVPLAEEYMRRVPDDLYAYTTLAAAYGLSGEPRRAAETMAPFRERFPHYRMADFIWHEPFRDEAVLDRLVDTLRAAGLPD